MKFPYLSLTIDFEDYGEGSYFKGYDSDGCWFGFKYFYFEVFYSEYFSLKWFIPRFRFFNGSNWNMALFNWAFFSFEISKRK